MSPAASAAGLHSKPTSSESPISIVTDASDTVSGTPAHGRSLGALLSVGSRRVVSALNRTVERLGHSPNVTMQHILVLLHACHMHQCRGAQSTQPPRARSTPEFSALIKEAAVLGSESCPACGCPFFRNMDLSLELQIIVQLNMLIESVRHKTILTRRLAVCYLHALAVMDPLMCNMLLELHVMSALETLLAQVSAKKRIDAEWLTLEDPIREALQALPPTTLWLSIPSSKTEQSHRGLAEVMVLIKLSRQPGPLGLVCLHHLSSVFHFWSGQPENSHSTSIPPEALLLIISYHITQDDLRRWHKQSFSSLGYRSALENLAKYLTWNLKMLPALKNPPAGLVTHTVFVNFTWGAMAERACESRRRVVSIEELGLKWLRIWSDTSMVMVVVGATSMLLIRDPILEQAMRRLIGSIEIATRADVPVWMFGMLGKTLRLFLGSHERVSRLWAASSTSLLASECLGALYRMMVTHVVTHAAELAEALAPLVAKGGSYKDAVAARQVEHLLPAHRIWRWHRMYFPLVHWIYTQSRPNTAHHIGALAADCEVCVHAQDRAYLQMFSDAAATDLAGSNTDSHTDGHRRFTFRAALSVLANDLRWTQTETDVLLADIVACIEVRISNPETVVDDKLVSGATTSK